MTKKIMFLSFLAAVAFAVLAATPALAYSPHEGDLIKTHNNPAVYYVDAANRRHLFPTESTFFSWYPGVWRDQTVLNISESDLNQLLIGGNITARPGFALLRFNNSLKMYAVLPGGKLCRAPAHYDNYQYNRALIIPASFEANYYNDGICDITANQKLPDGTLIRYNNSFDIYYIQNGQRRKLTADGFAANNFQYQSVIINVDWGMNYPDGAVISSREDTLVKPYPSSNYFCSENWSCTAWNVCKNGQQSRDCLDINRCGTTLNRPALSRTCQ